MKNKKISISLFIITVVFLLILQMSTSFAETGKSTASDVRIRKAPSTDSEVIDLLAVDEVVQILGKEGDWYKVSFKGKTGYVSQSYISVNNSSNANNQNSTNNENVNTNLSTEQNNDDQSSNVTATVTTGEVTNNVSMSVSSIYKIVDNTQVNILPTVTSESIGEIKKDENVTLINKAGLWAYVKSDSLNGWVRTDKLSAVDANSDSTANEENNPTDNSTTDAQEENNNTTVETQNYTPKTMYTSSAAVNVRSDSNTTSDIVDSVGINTEVRAIGEENGWYKVEVNGKTGYIRNDLLSTEKTQITSRNNDLDRASTVQNTTVEVSVSGDENAYETSSYVEPTASESSVPVSESGVSGYDVAAYAQQFVGYSYVYGAAGPNAFDCSGFTMYVYQHFGYSLSHASRVQATQGVPVSGELQPGDILVFSNDGRTVGHVGLYLGDDKFIHASTSTTGVIISNLHDSWNISKYWGARRIL